MAKALTAWVFTLAPLVQAYTYIKEVCPQNCNETGLHRTNWTYFHDLERLRYCEQPYLFETTIYTPATSSVIRACALSEATNTNTIQQVASKSRSDFGSSTNVTSGPLACGVAGSPISNRQGELHISWAANLSSLSSSAGTVASATQLLQQYIVADGDCNTTAIFASLGHVIVGAYVGSQVQKASAGSVLQQVIDQTRAGDAQHIVRAAEVCTKIQDSVLSYQTIGIFASAEGNVSAVQDALVNWNDGKCLLSNTTTSNIPITVKILSGIQGGGSGTLENNRTVSSRDNPNSGSPATCKYVQAVKDDNCWSLATQKCGITTDDFYKYNANGDWDKFCSGILPGDYVCCSAGMPPDFSPKPNPDGTCASYTVAANDGCKAIASKNSIKDYKKLDDFNKNTWGWQGCDVGLGLGQIICISSGSPNMPAYNPNAVCGPQVVGTQKPTNGTDWALLNQCPLNACCDAWGQCGTTTDFCIDTRDKSTMAPGTAKKDTNGCISNCGTDIVNSKASSSWAKVGYFESWNMDRPCLYMDISKMTSLDYTHVHFAFANITSSLQIDISGSQKQFDGLKKLTGIKRIISFGGWAFSTSPSSAPIFRQGVTAAQRTTFVNNVVTFLKNNNLDGVDFDWEYPGATDIPGAGQGSPQDGPNYLEFLKQLKKALPSDKTVSIAAPVSYWYLRNFPIKEISDVVDYIVYMTYDLHGQWDYGGTYSNPGCPSGNCLRSHVNMTETMFSLSMITKAGVPTNKIFLGMAKYGRSFNMADSSCRGPNCLFTGSFTVSDATPGKCTLTSGYISNYELNQIKSAAGDGGRQLLQYQDEGDIMIYDNNQWVSYLTQESYNSRVKKWQRLSFGGVSDWAADLETDYGSNGTGDRPDPPKSRDGSCGSKASPFGATCKGSGFGDCCGASGQCGSDDSHCGSGCMSSFGSCTVGGTTTDGTCGIGYNNMICGNWKDGSCCSAAGLCGSGDDFCGNGCQSGCFNAPSPKMALDKNFPDPSLVLDPTTGTYYSFATAGNGHQIQVAAKFRRESSWKLLDIEPMTKVGSWAENHDIWAPDVQYIANHSWVMYYSAPAAKDKTKHCVGAATSNDVSGPYTPRDDYIACDLAAGGAIDPNGFYDQASNTRWVVYKVDGNSLGGGGGPCGNADGKHSTPIMLQQVDLDGYTLIGKAIPLLNRGSADGPLIEAPSLVYENGLYILFFSSNCYSTTLYDVSYATSTSLTGPYTKSKKPLLVTGNFSLTAPGGATSNGNGFMVFQ